MGAAMGRGKLETGADWAAAGARAADRGARHWRWLVLGTWLLACVWLLWARWGAVYWFALGDTDDNLRMAEVRAWLNGQGWYDLRQYKLGGPQGLDIHWSRLVDLPIAGLILLGRLFLDGPTAERFAVAIAPLLPLSVLLTGVALTARRLIEPRAVLVALPLFFCALSTFSMFQPTRIDHHGWQLALLSLVAAGLADPKRVRGGATVGVTTALSLAIGLESLVYLALAGVAQVLWWVWDGGQRTRLQAYGATLAGGTALGFALFASEANRAAVCDALSPVWLSAVLSGGAAAMLLAAGTPASRAARFGSALLAGAIIAFLFWAWWPHCTTGRLEQVPPELDRLWLSNVREAKPIYRHSTEVMIGVSALPVAGLLGGALLLWTRRREPAPLARAAGPFALALAATALLLWQTRAGPAAGLLAVPFATALLWVLVPPFRRSRSMLVRVLGPVLVGLVATGALASSALGFIPKKPKTAAQKAVDLANRQCPTLPALRPVAQQPAGTVLTFVDLGPRLITVTHHRALAGPYHRNAEEIIDVQRAWRGDEANARRTIAKYRVDYVLICPNFSESTLYTSQAKGGFYDRLRQGQAPAWLQPVPLPPNNPYRMWRVRP